MSRPSVTVILKTTQVLVLAGTLAAKNMCNADCSSVAAIDSIGSFFLAKDTVGTTVTFGHKNEPTGMPMRAL